MAQFFDNFEGRALGNGDLPSYMTQVGGGTPVFEIEVDATSENNRVVRYAWGSTGMLFLNALPATVGDSEIVVRARYSAGSSNFLLRPRHIEDDKTDELGRLYEFRSTGTGSADIRQRNPSLSTLASGGSSPVTDTTVYHYVRAQYVSSTNTVRIKLWVEAVEDEPAGWYLETTGAISTALAGRQALSGFNTNFARIDWLGLGTDGDPAPTGPVTAGPTTPTGLITSAITATGFRAGWTP